MSTINSLTSNFLLSAINTAFQSAGLTANAAGGQSTAGVASAAQQSDSGQLSQFAQISSALQQLQQSNPSQYQQVTEQIATNLQSAAQTAQAGGNTTAANQLNQLSADFTSASQNGQLPNLQDLAQALSGHHGHHHSHANASASGDNDNDSAASTASPALSQFLASLQGSGTQNNSFNPAAIIFDTLSNAGINPLNS